MSETYWERFRPESAAKHLERLEWGSCDGCGGNYRCAVCGAEREATFDRETGDSYDVPLPGKHADWCPVPKWLEGAKAAQKAGEQ